MALIFKNILSLANKASILKTIGNPKASTLQLKPGPNGMMLKEILRWEWLNEVINNKDLTIFLKDTDDTETSEFAKHIYNKSLPFGIAEIISTRKKSFEEIFEVLERNHDDIEFSNMFLNMDDCMLKCTILVKSENSTQLFHQWQRQRNAWWRKFSASPGRYGLTEIKKRKTEQIVHIFAKYPWGHQDLEIIKYSMVPDNKNFDSQRDKNEPVLVHAITSIVPLTTMFLNTICDAYDKIAVQGMPRELFRFHRKLAPSKLTFAITPSELDIHSELTDLATYLCRQLREHNISTLWIPNNSKLCLEKQYQLQDELGIPFCIVLNKHTLSHGLCHLRNRDTTLKEQIHITDLIQYTEKLFLYY